MTTYTIQEISLSGNVIVSVDIDGKIEKGVGHATPDILADASKLKDFCEKLCAETELRLEAIISSKVDISLIEIDPSKVAVEKGKL